VKRIGYTFKDLRQLSRHLDRRDGRLLVDVEGLSVGEVVRVELEVEGRPEKLEVVGRVKAAFEPPRAQFDGAVIRLRRDAIQALDKFLRPATRRPGDLRERRDPRLPCRLPVSWIGMDGKSHVGTAVDISHGGALIASTEPPWQAERLKLQLPEGTVAASVVRVGRRGGWWTFSVKFETRAPAAVLEQVEAHNPLDRRTHTEACALCG
jgi:hypothetical protein